MRPPLRNLAGGVVAMHRERPVVPTRYDST